jgi:hypothetical protein
MDEDDEEEFLIPHRDGEPDDSWFETDDPAGWQPRDTDPEWWSSNVDPHHLVEQQERVRRQNRRLRWFLVAIALAIFAYVGWRVITDDDGDRVERSGGLTDYQPTGPPDTSVIRCVEQDGHMSAVVRLSGGDPSVQYEGVVVFTSRAGHDVLDRVAYEDTHPSEDEHEMTVTSDRPVTEPFSCRLPGED